MTHSLHRVFVAMLLLAVGVANAFAQEPKSDAPETGSEKIGKVFFTQQAIGKHSSSRSITNADGETYIDEYELGQPLYARAFFNEIKDEDHLSIRCIIDGEVFAEEDMREFWAVNALRNQYKSKNGGYGSATSSYYAEKGTAAIPLIPDKGKRFNGYALQEEAFRMLLSRLKDKIKVGKTMTLKVELFATQRMANEKKDADGPVLASGEVKVKVTPFSKDLANMLCRCGEKGMEDKALEADIAEAFKFGYSEHCEKVHKVVVNDRDYNIVTDRRNGAVKGRYVDASVIWESKDGDYWVAKHSFWFPFTGTSFADKAKLDAFVFAAPVPKLCAEGGKASKTEAASKKKK